MGLDEWRARIDEIDRQLLRLLSQRAELSLEIGRAKRESGEPVLVPEREQEILDELARLNPGPLLRRGDPLDLVRGPVGVPLSPAPVPRRLPRPPGNQHAPRRAPAIRLERRVPARARHSRGLRGSRARPGRRRRRADRELERGSGEPHPRRADRLGAPDLRRGVARDSPQPPLPRRRARRRQARLLASAGARAVPRLAQPAPAGRRRWWRCRPRRSRPSRRRSTRPRRRWRASWPASCTGSLRSASASRTTPTTSPGSS